MLTAVQSVSTAVLLADMETEKEDLTLLDLRDAIPINLFGAYIRMFTPS